MLPATAVPAAAVAALLLRNRKTITIATTGRHRTTRTIARLTTIAKQRSSIAQGHGVMTTTVLIPARAGRRHLRLTRHRHAAAIAAAQDPVQTEEAEAETKI